MSKLVNLTMFRGYVNKVLPTVYDDSLSYYEVLAKVMEKINEIINLDNAQNEIINNIPEDVSEFAEDLAQFKSTMTQQFNDFKTEINADFDAFEAEVNAKIAADSTPTQGSTKLVTSGGVYASLQDIINSLVKDARPTEDSTNYVTSGGVWKAINDAVEDLEATIDTKQTVLTWDTTPTANSTNPVQSGGIKSYVDNAKQAALDSLDNYITTNDSRVSGIEGDITDLETGKQDALTFDLTPTLGSNNPVTSNGIAQAIAGVTPSIEVDPVPTQGSTNPVSSNGVFTAVSNLETEIEEGLADKQDTLTWDTTPTKNSQNPVTSGGLFEKFAQIDPYGTVDPEPEQGSPNAVSSGGTWTALQTLNNDLTAAINTKQDTLTFDSVPTEDSENPVYSRGVFDGLAGKQDTLTFDAVPSEDSENPVYSGGIFAELALKSDKSETQQYPISDSVSDINPTITDSADGYVQNITVYGRTDTVEGELRGIGEDGELNVKTCGKNLLNPSTIGLYQATSDPSVMRAGFAPIYAHAGTYTLSYKRSTTNIALWITDISDYSYQQVQPNEQYVVSSNTYILVRSGLGDVAEFNALFTNIQLELSPIATNYESYVSTSAAVFTALPLYSVGDVKDVLDEKRGTVIKRCEKISEQGEEVIVPLATAVEIPLTASELSALRTLKTHSPTTNITATDNPTVVIGYLLNTDNGEAIAQLEDNINVKLNNKQNTLTFDATPTDSSTNPVTSGGVYTALTGKQNTLTWDNTPTEDSDNAISSGAVYDALQNAGGMQRALLYSNSTPLVLPATVTFGSDIRAYDVLQIEYTRLDTAVNDTITPQFIEIPVDTLDTYFTDYTGTYNIGVMLPGIDAEEVFYDINGLFTELTYDQSRSTLPTDITLNITRIFGVNYS